MRVWERIWDAVRLFDSGEWAAAFDFTAMFVACVGAFGLFDLTYGLIDASHVALFDDKRFELLASLAMLAASGMRIRIAAKAGRLD